MDRRVFTYVYHVDHSRDVEDYMYMYVYVYNFAQS